jgi:hypothetical protein
MKYFGVVADNGKRGLSSWKESAERHNISIVSYLEDLDAVILLGELENLENFADEETYAWAPETVRDYTFDTIEDAKYDVEMFIIHEIIEEVNIKWDDNIGK